MEGVRFERPLARDDTPIEILALRALVDALFAAADTRTFAFLTKLQETRDE